MKRGHLALGGAVAVGLVVTLLVVVLATSPPATDRIAKSPLVGHPAPGISAKTITGDSFDLSRYDGEWVLVNFFATWCVPCRQEHPQLRQFASEHANRGDAAVVSVMVNDDAATVKEFFAQHGGTWPVLVDPQASIALNYGLVKVPESYLITPNGDVAAKINGGVTAKGLDRVIADIEAGR